MIRILTIMASCVILTGCSVEVISDKEAIERMYAEEAKTQSADAEQIAHLFSNTQVNPEKIAVKLPDYNESPIFVSHAKRLEAQGLPYESSNLFTTEAYEDALSIQATHMSAKVSPVNEVDELVSPTH